MSNEFKIVFWGKGPRSYYCLKGLVEGGHGIDMVVGQSQNSSNASPSVVDLAEEYGLRVEIPENPNSNNFQKELESLNADIFILGGYGKILKSNIINLPRIMCINLHGGKLPEYRGSSPMNWSLINGETSFGLSVLKIDSGIDTGDVIMQRSFPIKSNDTIRDLHEIANKEFPKMLLEVISQVKEGNFKLSVQEKDKGNYYPLRFPEDGLVIFDKYSALQVHNRIRALTTPFPGAFTFLKGQKVKLLASCMQEPDYYGEPGRVYKKSKQGILVCASDKCLWITELVFESSGESALDAIKCYDRLTTISGIALKMFNSR